MSAFLISIEGSDSVGKETQSIALQELLWSFGRRAIVVSFPRYKETAAGRMLWQMIKGPDQARYDVANLDPHVASIMYATDRLESLPYLTQLMEEQDVIIFDRYVESNMIHQGGKFSTDEERLRFGEWLEHLEYTKFRLPRPDMTMYLDVPLHVALARAEKRREPLDAVESNMEYIKRNHEAGRFYAERLKWTIISGVSESGHEYSTEEVHQLITHKMEQHVNVWA